MSAPLHDRRSDLSPREQATVSAAAMSEVPWRLAGAAGVVVAGADLLLHLTGGGLGLASSLSAGIVAFFAVAGVGVLARRRRAGRALRWARANPWRFAVLPGAGAAVLVFVLSTVFGGGPLGSAFTAIWHGAIAFGLTGAAGVVTGGRRRSVG